MSVPCVPCSGEEKLYANPAICKTSGSSFGSLSCEPLMPCCRAKVKAARHVDGRCLGRSGKQAGRSESGMGPTGMPGGGIWVGVLAVPGIALPGELRSLPSLKLAHSNTSWEPKGKGWGGWIECGIVSDLLRPPRSPSHAAASEQRAFTSLQGPSALSHSPPCPTAYGTLTVTGKPFWAAPGPRDARPPHLLLGGEGQQGSYLPTGASQDACPSMVPNPGKQTCPVSHLRHSCVREGAQMLFQEGSLTSCIPSSRNGEARP